MVDGEILLGRGRGHKLIKHGIFKIKDGFYILTAIVSLPSKAVYLKTI